MVTALIWSSINSQRDTFYWQYYNSNSYPFRCINSRVNMQIKWDPGSLGLALIASVPRRIRTSGVETDAVPVRVLLGSFNSARLRYQGAWHG